MIYLNNAATSRTKPAGVAEAVMQALTSGLGSSGRGAGDNDLDAARTVFAARMNAARLLGSSHPERVVFCANGTQALNMALWGLLGSGDHAITTDLDHNSVLRPLYALEHERGTTTSFLPADRTGRLCYEQLDSLFTPRTRLVVCTHASNLTGSVTDLSVMAEAAHRHGALLVVDAAQTAGCHYVNMESAGIDVLCFTGHKSLMGPQGTGGLIAAPHVDIRPTFTGGTGVHSFEPTQPDAWPEHLEAGTLNAHGIAGLNAGISFVLEEGVPSIQAHGETLRRRFLDQVRAIPGIVVYGPSEASYTPVVALNIVGMDSAVVADKLAQTYGIEVRAGLHCAPRAHAALGTLQTGTVRFSFGWFTTVQEIDAATQALAQIANTSL